MTLRNREYLKDSDGYTATMGRLNDQFLARNKKIQKLYREKLDKLRKEPPSSERTKKIFALIDARNAVWDRSNKNYERKMNSFIRSL
jgi:hypothetical protein